MPEPRTCKNCETELTGKFCHVCGQRDISAGITFRQLISDFVSANFALEGPLIFTIRQLAIDPGLLVREFIAGRRKRYYKPVQFFLVSTLVYLSMHALLNYDPLEGQFTQEVPEEVAEIKRITMEASQFMVKYINHLLFLLPASLALILKLFHFKRQTLAEFLVSGFYVTGVYIQIGTVEALVQTITGVLPEMPAFRFLIFMAYFSYMHVSYLGGFTVGRLFRSILIGLLSLVLYILTTFGVAVFFVLI